MTTPYTFFRTDITGTEYRMIVFHSGKQTGNLQFADRSQQGKLHDIIPEICMRVCMKVLFEFKCLGILVVYR